MSRQKTSGAEGERLKEASNINKSLSTLGFVLAFLFSSLSFPNIIGICALLWCLCCRLVIMNLVSISNGKNLHVPYRDSKLTFLLQVIYIGFTMCMLFLSFMIAIWNIYMLLGFDVENFCKMEVYPCFPWIICSFLLYGFVEIF